MRISQDFEDIKAAVGTEVDRLGRSYPGSLRATYNVTIEIEASKDPA